MHLYILILISAFIYSCQSPASKEYNKPNIILIMADDLGYNELGCYGQEIIKTPNIDRLAKEGIRFTQFYAGSPVCAPSRGVLLTGMHTGHAYVRDNYELGGYTDGEEGGQLPLKEGTITIGSLLKQQGYVTAAIGKWGLGGPDSEGVPNKQGFDYFYGYLCQKQAHNYYPSHLWENENWDSLKNDFFMAHQKFSGDLTDTMAFDQYIGVDYSQDKMIRKAIDFITENKDTSFFLYVPFTVPHLALQIPENDFSLQEYKKQIPDSAYLGNRGYLPNKYPRATYAAMITRMDREVGRIKNLLFKLGLDENTLIMFTSDNGPTYGGIGGSDTEFFKSAGNLRGLKGSVYEGGIRVPMIAWWKGKIMPNTITDHVSYFADFFPTLADLVKTTNYPQTDGLSFLPEIQSEGNQKEHQYLYWEFPSYGGQVAVRMRDWKGVRQGLKKNPDQPIELYNLKNDVGETTDVSDEFPEIVESIKKILDTSRIQSEYFPFPALDNQ